jgi:hypothetical protein
MRPSRHALGLVCAFALAGAFVVGGCKKPDTVLLVEVEGPVDVNPNQLRVTVIAGIDARVIFVPAVPLAVGREMNFPTSFSVSIDQSRTAPITVRIDALEKEQAPIGYSGTTTYQHVEIGGQTTVTVVLTEGAGFDQPDGGPDAGTGGTAGASGATGAGGAGGAAGQDGATDETGDAGLGLDGAAD